MGLNLVSGIAPFLLSIFRKVNSGEDWSIGSSPGCYVETSDLSMVLIPSHLKVPLLTFYFKHYFY